MDVFISYDRADAAAVQRIVSALEAAGLRVFLDVEQIRQFESISDRLRLALGESRTLLAYYSRSYGSRRACQEEFTTAYLAGPEHVLVVNPEPGTDHLAPREILDVLLPGHPSLKPALSALVEAVRERVATVSGTIGSKPAPERLDELAAPTKFTGRWTELWQLHSVLSHGGTAVVHGVVDSGKSTLARAYVQEFGRTYYRVLLDDWSSAQAGDLVVVEDVTAPLDDFKVPAARLLLTRDPRLAKLGTGIELGDLREDELDLDPALRLAAEGSTGLARRLAEQFSSSTAVMLDRLHQSRTPLLAPVADRLEPIVTGLGKAAWDVVRALGATSPVPLPLDVIADILAGERGQVGDSWLDTVKRTVSDLLASGVLVDDGLGGFRLPRAFQLALRQTDPRPARAEEIRETAVQILASRARPRRTGVARRRSTVDDEERRTAHRILNELTSRVSLHELPDGEGLLRDALSSLHTLFDRIRQICGEVDPDTLRPSTPVRPGLATLTRRLQDDILRPFLLYWHPRLSDHHELRPSDVGSHAHELAWPLQTQLRSEFSKLQLSIAEVADELAVLSGNPLS
ncbi:toll/interleukin-1 receptor domain-containing protein [Amycolatopsis sp. NPDC059090]|uniref:toll/interleukin-1 receptor domain-containing protein n=1 Tax=unclassified Amycolatopsis TaxID=2618356 RepID=UPI00366CF4B3